MRIATPFEGPKPGNAPIIVPRIQPMIAKLKVVGVSAIPKPRAKFWKSSIYDQPIRNFGKGNRLSPKPNLNITNKDNDKIIPVDDDLKTLGLIR